MFLFKSKKKKRSSEALANQDDSSANNDIYVKNGDLLNIRLPDDFSSIVLPQLIGYEHDENGNTISSPAVIQNDDNSHHQHRHTTPICREGWYPVTRFIGGESNRGTLVDTTNITAASLVQANKRLSVSFSSSFGDTLTCHSKEDSSNDHSTCSDKLDHPSHPVSSFSSSASACIDRSAWHQHVPHLRNDRPKFKRNHPRFTILTVAHMETMNESSTTITTAIIEPKHPQSITTTTTDSRSLSSTSTSTSASLSPRCISPATFADDETTIITTDTPCKIPTSKHEYNEIGTEKRLKSPTQRIKRTRGEIKLPTDGSASKLRQPKRHSVPESPATDGSMIPRRPRSSCSSSSSSASQKQSTTTKIQKVRKTQSRKQDLNTTNGSGSRIPVRAPTMKV